ncbi:MULTISPECIES: hypothetical protein [unclassified Mucilaginibacter]|uniref:hypothetical protein n=1 Tax=unclassified Mucilaginibacter TaxID=2617802 RepID=UPI002AC98199|nr:MULTISPECIES: hypothetical protein [unclassified Mucilaginibacter]MEB0262659.1 hypothetical protein [Mucilaginibacter sp. 10I4]MEB0280611.1 hypothetical protein [Mucilaginibacter sp. 10B2]MEB0300284.1 hypothetical protein [Mucilaginibacter sp. 5C4]WPX24971.1 hypothetical protein RHM67_06810 [Mucilaginibacter sp. 5C4]
MAQFTFTNNTYAGEALAGFMASTLLEADSVKRGLLTVINDVKQRKIILDVDDDVVLQNPSGIFADQGTTATQTESYLDPVVYEFMKQEQWDKLVQSWESQQLKPGAFLDYEGVVDLSDFMVQRYLTKIQIANERLYWLGKGSTKEAAFTAPFTGLLPSIAAASGVYKVGLGKSETSMAATAISGLGVVTVNSTATLRDGDVVTITNVTGMSKDTTNGGGGVDVQGQSYFIQVAGATTFKLVRNYNEVNTRKAATFSGSATAATVSYINASNVLGVLTGIYAQLDPADRSQEDFNLQIPLHVGYAYAQAQADKAVNVLNAFTDPKKMDYLGVPLQLMNHWQANTILGARSSNLFLGVDLLGDASELSTVYMKPYTNDNVVRMKARMKAAVNFKFANELFYLGA